MTIDERIAEFATAWSGRHITTVKAVASDWEGSTEDGFRSIFELELIGPDGFWRQISGEELGDFWSYVMRQPMSEPHETVTE